MYICMDACVYASVYTHIQLLLPQDYVRDEVINHNRSNCQ